MTGLIESKLGMGGLRHSLALRIAIPLPFIVPRTRHSARGPINGYANLSQRISTRKVRRRIRVSSSVCTTSSITGTPAITGGSRVAMHSHRQASGCLYYYVGLAPCTVSLHRSLSSLWPSNTSAIIDNYRG